MSYCLVVAIVISMTKVLLKPCPCSNCAQKSGSKFDIWPLIRHKSKGVLAMVWHLPQCLSWQKSVLWQICLKTKIQPSWQGSWKLLNNYGTGHPHLLRWLQIFPQGLDSVLSSAQLLLETSVCPCLSKRWILQLPTCTNGSKSLQSQSKLSRILCCLPYQKISCSCTSQGLPMLFLALPCPCPPSWCSSIVLTPAQGGRIKP